MLPPSFKMLGAVTVDESRTRRIIPGGKRPGIMIKSYGVTQSGKTEFALSAPDPGIILCVDKQADGVMDNSKPPETRRDNWGWVDYELPVDKQAADFKGAWASYRDKLYECVKNADAKTVIIDGDSDTWDLQLLCDHGKLTQIMPIARTGTNASRRALLSRLYFSGKIIICTNKVKDEYETVYGTDGKPQKDSTGNDLRVKTGGTEVAGYRDNNYLFHLVLEHFRVPAVELPERKVGKIMIPARSAPATWGVRVIKCKANTELEGMEFKGDECNLPTVLQAAYPNVGLKDWGYV